MGLLTLAVPRFTATIEPRRLLTGPGIYPAGTVVVYTGHPQVRNRPASGFVLLIVAVVLRAWRSGLLIAEGRSRVEWRDGGSICMAQSVGQLDHGRRRKEPRRRAAANSTGHSEVSLSDDDL